MSVNPSAPEAPPQDASASPTDSGTVVAAVAELIGQEAAFAIVLGCAGFGIAWGIVNSILISRVDMNDSTHLRKEEGEGEG